MIFLRSLAFALVFYAWSAAVALVMSPLVLAPRRWLMKAMAFWASSAVVLLEIICAVKVEFRGREHLPVGAALIGAKHQGMFDTIAPFALFDDAAYVMKRELMFIPFYGWYCARAGMIVVDRGAQAKALRKLIADARDRAAAGRQIVIFPEGHRTAPGAHEPYKPGVAALYRELGLPCTPLATNSGVHWPAHGFLRRPGRIVYEFLEPIPAGLPRREFMRRLEEKLEAASQRLFAE